MQKQIHSQSWEVVTRLVASGLTAPHLSSSKNSDSSATGPTATANIEFIVTMTPN